MIRWWIDLWNHQERPLGLALVRIAVALVLLWDLGAAFLMDLVPVLWSPPEVGGLPANLLTRDPLPEVYRWLPPTTDTAWLVYGVTMAGLVGFGLGLFTRLSGLVLLLGYAQLALILPLGDRGIDLLLRNTILVLLFSPSAHAMSLDALRRTGRWLGDGGAHPAWARHLLVLQLVVVYWMAGVQKTAITWTPLGSYHALYIVLQDPHVARFEFGWLRDWWLLPSIATASTHIFEWTAPAILLAFHYRATWERPGRVRAFFNRWRVLWWYVFIGAMLHLGIALTMNLGIFPFAMLALYPAYFHADELSAAWARLTGKAG